ncbi:Fe-S cluster assembly transcriptional regulator IscR [Kerstersia gyiorum]|jgi:Rrf2 family iron-sulfur cluster assembly transcriptional regulator|uniref:BadM/Rrf2 family transcriptional regulator n=1 Tax=Kerstersia gyiorum TaxID=206506 RepID=A0A171KUA9_9BURK|nr:Fe-S cluster assembly transcriptional regulator IscR [Kerstersia gyiorum]AZV93365.1 Fe-S cluster assembly transcriptional regulator IscR [Bordetella sp. J329]MCO7636488.1 Fe-S cluster assembly transcriptional regulator IscR [Pseudomonas sp. S 311-6]KAB0543743.1 Fe-S cluster assembly transcriptional regulator IscR [Kerstersia gyiorum]KKO72476.1 DNA-binding protein [Kerstersia gyiorum]MCH4271994.1 Fe-S cluster assembly transcriptional regulator IscR [Kerstersia gyiorum]
MRLTTKGRFAVTAMIDLALRQHSGPVTLAAISQRQNISLSYLEQLFGKLRRHELVESMRGPGGGYSLARVARKVTVADIIFAVDEPLDATSCGGKRDCSSGKDGRSGKCMTHELWSTLNRKMVDYLDSVSLQDLVDQHRMRMLQEASQEAEHGVATAVRVEKSSCRPAANKAAATHAVA